MKTINVETSLGILRGLDMEDGTLQFRGVRYGTAKRWMYPEAVEKWDGEYDATKFRAACFQNRSFNDEASTEPTPFYYKEFRENEHYDYSEDCLFLNIYAPENAKEADVIIYIHGGAFMGGCGNEKHMDGSAYAKRGIIFVSINYRLGPLGFLCDKKLKEESGHSGNYGLYDQLEAIKWVYHHISAFGGNPKKITLFGQSAGAMSVQQHVLSPLTKPYIYAAYMASGGGIGNSFGKVDKEEESYEYCEKMTAFLGENPKEWREKTVEEVFQAFWKSADQSVLSHFCPHIDGLLIEKDPNLVLEEGQQAHIPYLMSSNEQDIVPNELHAMAYQWCEKVGEMGDDAYCFRFNRHLPGDDAGAFHSSELWYTIGAFQNCWRPMTEWDETVKEALLDAISNFAHCGNPNGKKIQNWEPIAGENQKVFVIEDKEMKYGTIFDISSDIP
ncbi:MAG: carboxylesterase family protein [Lachnospiraceae bacterium]|nr:carboxylesterase family protein [Lachnospiraceae bacterium]